ncbi:MAG: ISNCY family transposase [Candidatus Omnitrophica bacterium]|nr:ISNCY family transposase [Candidatus Omnitrophota bacterium]
MGCREDMIMVKAEELKRYQVVGKIFDKNINQQEAASLLGITDRQVRRLVRRVRFEGERGVVHRSRGRKGRRRIAEAVRVRILDLYKERYQGFGPTLASEKLWELDHVRVSDETLRLWLITEGLWTAGRRGKLKDRSWRARKDKFGEMVQMDGSHHAWLEDRGPKLVLMGYIDDATSTFHGNFFEYEGTKPAMGGLRSYAGQYGLPGQVYLDKHSTYKNNNKRCANWTFEDKESLTQFERACRQLGIEVIHANSPQAKGRIERVFRTLQDRLVKEMRLRGIKTLEEANRFLEEYLPKFNAKFAVEARLAGDFHRPVDRSIKIDEILSVQVEHVLRNDRTVLHDRKLYQVLKKTRARRVVVFEYLDGQMAVKHDGSRLPFKAIEQRPVPVPALKPPHKFKRRNWQYRRKNSPWGGRFLPLKKVAIGN